MIIKSMSRKEPTFGQLISYMASEKSDDRYDLYHHCFSRNQDDLIIEFLKNSQRLKQRKNGNYLYHEIISLTVEEGVERSEIKASLREISLRYVQGRCPKNMVYGCLHEDHEDHLHYHLLISANEAGDTTRARLTKKNFDAVKRELEQYVLTQYPLLKQKSVMTGESKREKLSAKASGMKKRSGKLPKRDRVTLTLREAMNQSSSVAEFERFLTEQGFEYYTRGKNFGVNVVGQDGKSKKYRFSTLGVHVEFVSFQQGIIADKTENSHRQTYTDNSDSQSENETQPRSKQADEHTKNTRKSTADEAEQKIRKVHDEFRSVTKKKKPQQNSGQKPKT